MSGASEGICAWGLPTSTTPRGSADDQHAPAAPGRRGHGAAAKPSMGVAVSPETAPREHAQSAVTRASAAVSAYDGHGVGR